jgi:hypothetical protein
MSFRDSSDWLGTKRDKLLADTFDEVIASIARPLAELLFCCASDREKRSLGRTAFLNARGPEKLGKDLLRLSSSQFDSKTSLRLASTLALIVR